MDRDNKYYNLIETLVKSHRKFPGYEMIIDDIINDVYVHSETVINNINDENVVKAYLQKVVSTSIITVPKRMNFHNEVKHREITPVTAVIKKTEPSQTEAPKIVQEQEQEKEQDIKEEPLEQAEGLIIEKEELETQVIHEQKVNVELVDKMINSIDADSVIETENLVNNLDDDMLDEFLSDEVEETVEGVSSSVDIPEDVDISEEDDSLEMALEGDSDQLEEASDRLIEEEPVADIIEEQEIVEAPVDIESSNVIEEENILFDLTTEEKVEEETETHEEIEEIDIQEIATEDAGNSEALLLEEENDDDLSQPEIKDIVETDEIKEKFEQSDIQEIEGVDVDNSGELSLGENDYDLSQPVIEDIVEVDETQVEFDESNIQEIAREDADRSEVLLLEEENDDDLSQPENEDIAKTEETQEIIELEEDSNDIGEEQLGAIGSKADDFENNDLQLEEEEESSDLYALEPEDNLESDLIELDESSEIGETALGDDSLESAAELDSGFDLDIHDDVLEETLTEELDESTDNEEVETSGLAENIKELENNDGPKQSDYSVFSYSPVEQLDSCDENEITQNLISLDSENSDLHILEIFDMKYKQGLSIDKIAEELQIDKQYVVAALDKIINII